MHIRQHKADMAIFCCPFYKTDMDGFRRTVDVTMWGVFNALRAVSKHMIARQKGGNIVVVG